jgi:hypothetical protein
MSHGPSSSLDPRAITKERVWKGPSGIRKAKGVLDMEKVWCSSTSTLGTLEVEQFFIVGTV